MRAALESEDSSCALAAAAELPVLAALLHTFSHCSVEAQAVASDMVSNITSHSAAETAPCADPAAASVVGIEDCLLAAAPLCRIGVGRYPNHILFVF